MSVSTIIVTYNRREDLLRCIEAVLAQTVPPDYLLIVNNASTDDTEEFLYQKYGEPSLKKKVGEEVVSLLCEYGKIPIYLINKITNTGGAGGFHTGLKVAHEYFVTDYYWMMDDDGFPATECLEQLIPYLKQCDYVMPVSIDIENKQNLSWPVRIRSGKKTLSYQIMKDSWGKIMNYIFPFNGSLLTEKIVREVGYINEKLFIWGDEYEHYWRCKKKGYQPITVTDAVFFHPANKMSFVPIMGGLLRVPFAESKLKMICLARNYTYIYYHYDKRIKIPVKFLMYTWLFLITRKWDIQGWLLYCNSVKDGIRGDFTRHLKYLPK